MSVGALGSVDAAGSAGCAESMSASADVVAAACAGSTRLRAIVGGAVAGGGASSMPWAASFVPARPMVMAAMPVASKAFPMTVLPGHRSRPPLRAWRRSARSSSFKSTVCMRRAEQPAGEIRVLRPVAADHCRNLLDCVRHFPRLRRTTHRRNTRGSPLRRSTDAMLWGLLRRPSSTASSGDRTGDVLHAGTLHNGTAVARTGSH